MILLVDNYDSFTFNLYQALAVHCGLLSSRSEREGEAPAPRSGVEGATRAPIEVQVVRNDQMTCEAILEWKPSHIILSPGPKTPNESGLCLELIQKVGGNIPLLGVCLGHQAIAVAFGGNFVPAKQILHGKVSKIFHKEEGIFKNLPNPFEATRYHSLAVSNAGLPPCLRVTARAEDGEIMGMQHITYPIYGVQFHPESILTTSGPHLLSNFLKQ